MCILAAMVSFIICCDMALKKAQHLVDEEKNKYNRVQKFDQTVKKKSAK